MIDEDRKPLPQPSELARPFWQHVRAHEIAIQYCAKCDRYIHPPLPFCPSCRAHPLGWRVVPGTGSVYSFTIVHRAPVRAFRADLPYIICLVTLDLAGVRLLSNLVGRRPGSASVGDRVRTVFDDVAPDATIFRFVPAGAP